MACATASELESAMELAGTSTELAPGKLQDSAPIAAEPVVNGKAHKLSKRTSDLKAYARSKVSNSPAELPNVDGRSLIARRFRDIARAILVDQQGGEGVSEVRLTFKSMPSCAARWCASRSASESLASRKALGRRSATYCAPV
jgi:hypothetical protein